MNLQASSQVRSPKLSYLHLFDSTLEKEVMSFFIRLFGVPSAAHSAPIRAASLTPAADPNPISSTPAQPEQPEIEPPTVATEEPSAADDEPPAEVPPSGDELTDEQAQAAGYTDAAEERAVEQDKASTDSIQSSNQRACECIQNEDYAGAEAALLACIARKEELYGADDDNTIMTVENLAKVYVKMEEWAKAEEQFERVLNSQRAASDAPSVGTISTLNSLGFVRNQQGKHDAAEQAFVEAAKEKEALYTEDPSQLLSAYNNVGYTNCFQKNYEGAESYFTKSAAIEESDPSTKGSVSATENIAYAQKMQRAVVTN